MQVLCSASHVSHTVYPPRRRKWAVEELLRDIAAYAFGPSRAKSRAPLFAACTLNATGPYRVTLSLR